MRRLGAPVIKVNVEEDQLNDRVDDALEKYAEYHFNGTEQAYVKYQLTAQDIQNQYITLPDNVIGAIEIFPMQGFTMTGQDMFDVRYQIALNDLYTLSGTDLVPYTMTMSHLSLMNELLIGHIPIRYNRYSGNRLFLDTNWNELHVGTYLIVSCHQVLDPEEFTGIYNDMWLKDYLTALIKKQWGTNLSKFQGMPLPGGMAINGLELLQQAEGELAKCENDLETKYTMPIAMRWG